MLLPQERIPWLLRQTAFSRDVMFRGSTEGNAVYLTFDDGPIPESTPWILETLEKHGAHATFFMVADNARRYPDLHRAVAAAGHSIGNHTYHHVPPLSQTVEEMMEDVALADGILHSRLFRPPHGLISRRQQEALLAAGYRIVMFDINSLDYRADRLPATMLRKISRHVRPGSVINFHDSLKSIGKHRIVLPRILETLSDMGYSMEALPSPEG